MSDHKEAGLYRAVSHFSVDFNRASCYKLTTIPGCKVRYLAVLSAALSACRASKQSQVGYQGPGEPENIQRVERGAVKEDHFSFLEIEVPKTLFEGI